MKRQTVDWENPLQVIELIKDFKSEYIKNPKNQ